MQHAIFNGDPEEHCLFKWYWTHWCLLKSLSTVRVTHARSCRRASSEFLTGPSAFIPDCPAAWPCFHTSVHIKGFVTVGFPKSMASPATITIDVKYVLKFQSNSVWFGLFIDSYNRSTVQSLDYHQFVQSYCKLRWLQMSWTVHLGIRPKKISCRFLIYPNLSVHTEIFLGYDRIQE